MSIVFVTVPGDEKRMFANALHEKTKGNVRLVIIQKPRQKQSFLKRLKRLHNKVAWYSFPKEFWYALLLRVNGAKRALKYFREFTVSGQQKYIPEFLEVDSVNSDEVYEIIKTISPKLLVIWGNTILAPRLLDTAEKSINLHMGLCPFYVGALANQHAVLLEDFSHIGATIHYAKEEVDSGDIIATISADQTKPPKEMFRDLNNQIISLFLDISVKIFAGDNVPAIPQNISQSKKLLLRQWVPSIRYMVGSKLLKLEKEYKK